jgi:hypothetical protein
MFWSLALLASPAMAEPIVAVDYVPFSRADLVWLEESRTSGTGVGEFDGLIKPSLTPWVGVRGAHWTGMGTLGAARIATVTTNSTGRHISSNAGVRLGASLQRNLGEWETAQAWIGMGAWGVIPFSKDRNDAYSEAQAAEADFNSSTNRARIGGMGARAGGGVDFPLLPAAQIGFHTHLVAHTGVSFTETSTQYSVLTWVETALRLQVALR